MNSLFNRLRNWLLPKEEERGVVFPFPDSNKDDFESLRRAWGTSPRKVPIISQTRKGRASQPVSR